MSTLTHTLVLGVALIGLTACNNWNSRYMEDRNEYQQRDCSAGHSHRGWCEQNDRYMGMHGPWDAGRTDANYRAPTTRATRY